MFYCPKCLNIYNITKSIKSKEQAGGENKIEDIIKKIIDNDILDNIKFTEDDLENLNKSQTYKKLPVKQKDYIYNFINEMVEKKHPKNITANTRNMYFICKNCGNSETIKEGTMIASRENSKTIMTDNTFNAKEYLQMHVLPRTRQYDCMNDKCESHTKPDKKSAVFMRLPNSYNIRYICETCETAWMAS